MRIYANLIDQLLSEEAPDYGEVGLTEAKKSGDALLEDGHKNVDRKFINDIAGESEHTVVPAGSRVTAFKEDWRNRASSAVEDSDILADVTLSDGEAKGQTLDKRQLTDSEIQNYVKNLLNKGVAPVRIAARLEKLAELNLFNKGMATDYLNSHAGLLGLAYIEPNSFMNKCPDTYDQFKLGAKQAKSVKQIASCKECRYRKEATCNLYHLPIVASQKDLASVVESLTPGVPANQKRAALIRIANAEKETKPLSPLMRNTEKTVLRTAGGIKQQIVEQYSPEQVGKDLEKGTHLSSIFKYASEKVGTAKAAESIRRFIATLKSGNKKVAISQLDCRFLKGKLSSKNAIIGESKCSSCAYRRDMHCGLTGGTLLSFPGMDKQSSQHKVASGAPKDGRSMLTEYDLTHKKPMGDIEIGTPRSLDIQLGSKPSSGTL